MVRQSSSHGSGGTALGQVLLSQPRAPAASPVLTVHKISPTAAEHRHSSVRNHLQVSGPGFISPPDSSFDGHTGWSVNVHGINQLLGVGAGEAHHRIPWEMRGNQGRNREGSSWGHT